MDHMHQDQHTQSPQAPNNPLFHTCLPVCPDKWVQVCRSNSSHMDSCSSGGSRSSRVQDQNNVASNKYSRRACTQDLMAQHLTKQTHNFISVGTFRCLDTNTLSSHCHLVE